MWRDREMVIYCVQRKGLSGSSNGVLALASVRVQFLEAIIVSITTTAFWQTIPMRLLFCVGNKPFVGGTAHQELRGDWSMDANVLDNYFPVTFGWGFIKSNPEPLSEFLCSWFISIYKCKVTSLRFDCLIENSLEKLLPLTFPRTKILLVPTESGWCAIFDNGARGPDLVSLLSVATSKLIREGIQIKRVRDRQMFGSKDKFDHFTCIGYDIYDGRLLDQVGPTRSFFCRGITVNGALSIKGNHTQMNRPNLRKAEKVVFGLMSPQ